jgi:predicted nucleic acid-binding protein
VKQFLLDTNVLSEMSRPRPSRTVVASLRNIPLDAMFLSDVVIAEIRFGTENVGNPARRDMLQNWLKNDVRPSFAGRILPVTEDIFVRWRWIVEMNRRKGYTFEQSDALLAATAVHHNLTVLTRDIEPFERSEVTCLNPWQPQ